MTFLRRAATISLILLVVAVFAGVLLAPAPYAKQFREAPNSAASAQHPLGTDDLGRDSFSRLLVGTAISLMLAPAAAFLATLLAALLGGLTAYSSGWVSRILLAAINLSLSLPWIFLLITVRALLPLNVAPLISVAITFALLGILGWPTSARIIYSRVQNLRNSEFVLQARAAGCSDSQILLRHVLPNVQSLLLTQFWLSVPLFILAEANLGILGLGVAEPLPSWGTLLGEMQYWPAVQAHPLRLFPLLLLVLVVSCIQLSIRKQELL